MENKQTNPSKGYQRRRRLIRFFIVTSVLIFSVSAWFYTHFRPSTSLIDKFIFVNDAMEHSLVNLKNSSDQSLRNIKADVKKNGNNREGLTMIKRSVALKKRSANLLGELDKIKNHLITYAGDGLDPKTHSVKRPKDQWRTAMFMVGLPWGKKGEGYVLEKKLNDYNNWVNKEYKDLIKADFKPLTKITGEENETNFVHHNFWRKPVVLAMAKLTQLQHQILENEAKVLQSMKKNIPYGDALKFDRIYTGVSAESNILRSGDTYQATMMIAAVPSKANARMTVNGEPIPVENGIGKVRIKTTYPLGKKTWEGTITFKDRGRDTTFRIKKEYIVIPRMK